MKKHTFVFLDGLRGLAALLVMVAHTNDYFGVWGNRSYLAVDVFYIKWFRYRSCIRAKTY